MTVDLHDDQFGCVPKFGWQHSRELIAIQQSDKDKQSAVDGISRAQEGN